MESRFRFTAPHNVSVRPGPDPDWDWCALRERCLREASRVLDDPVEAEDVVQEALVRAWRRSETCRRRDARLPWLLTITRHEAHRWRAGPRGRREPGLDEGALHDVPDADRPAGEDGLLERLAVQAAVGRLSAEDRRLVELRYEEDLTQAAIAESLHVPEGTVKVRLHRLRHRLREELAT
jgi:RNA polymerase sigma-70 factor (ECF subfamily)